MRVASLEQGDETPCPDAADADHLAGRIDDLEPLQQAAPVVLEGFPVRAELLADRMLGLKAIRCSSGSWCLLYSSVTQKTSSPEKRYVVFARRRGRTARHGAWGGAAVDEVIDDGTAALVVVGESKIERAVDEAALKAEKHIAKELHVNPATSTPLSATPHRQLAEPPARPRKAGIPRHLPAHPAPTGVADDARYHLV